MSHSQRVTEMAAVLPAQTVSSMLRGDDSSMKAQGAAALDLAQWAAHHERVSCLDRGGVLEDLDLAAARSRQHSGLVTY